MVGCFASIPGRAWFDDVTVERCAAPEWREEPAGRYRYFTLPGDEIPAAAKAFNEKALAATCKFLEVGAPASVAYYKYADLDVKEELTGVRGNAHMQGGAIHTIFTKDNHEIVHVLTPPWGDPPALLGEGIAVYLSGGWQGKELKDVAAKLEKDGAWIPLRDLVDTRAFRRHSDLVTYGICGAFCEWIVETRGKETLRALYGKLKNGAPAQENLRALEEVLGRIDEVDAALRAWS
jgi:hypothetical protein